MRIRTIKPEFFLHSDLFDLEERTDLPIRVSFIGLWCACDRRGRFKWRPRELKARILPYDACDFTKVLTALVDAGFVEPYACATRDSRVDDASVTRMDASKQPNFIPEFGWIPGFERHQVINNRERDSDLPNPLDPTTSTRAPRVPHACPTPLNLDQGEGKGREGNKEGKGREQGSEVAKRLLAYLNEKTGAKFRAVDSHLELISGRLAEEGVTEEGVRQMIDRQVAKWKGDPKMSEFLRPQTLFGKQKFQSYYDQRELPVVAELNGNHIQTPSDYRNSYIGGSELWDATSGKLAEQEGQGF